MNAIVGWSLAALALAAGWQAWGWPGVALAVSVIVFWLLLQFSRSLRVMRMAAGSPVGRVGSAVMLHAGLVTGWPMLKLLTLTRSLGRRVSATPEVWAWADEGGAQVEVTLVSGHIAGWVLTRPADAGGIDTPAVS